MFSIRNNILRHWHFLEEVIPKHVFFMESLRKTTYFSPKRNKVAEIIKKKPEISISQAMIQAGYSSHTSKAGKEMQRVRNSPQVQNPLKQHQEHIDKLIQKSYK